MRRLLLLSLFFSCLFCLESVGQTTITIGTGSSSSSTRGPFQRSDTNSSTVYSRFVQIYTANELSAAGLTAGASISELQWELASSNVIIGSGDATMKVYVKNSSATAAVADTWTNQITGSSLVVDNAYNTTNNFPGANGWMPFTFSSPFTYTGGALEIAVDWDCSMVSTPAFSGDGAIKWRWASTAPDFLVVKKTSSSAPSSNISDLKDERANIQIVFNASSCPAPSNLNATNVTANGADLSWSDTGASAYIWKIVPVGAGSGATAIDGGTSMMTSVTTTALSPLSSYDLFVEADCGGGSTSGYAGPYTFLTQASAQSVVTIGTGSSSSSTRGPFQRSDTNSSTVFSRFVHIYTANELAAAGIVAGSNISALNWELASSNVMIGSGNATLKVYVKNSTATAATAGDWSTLISGSTLAVDNIYNTSINFPGMNGWMSFPFSAPFVYNGGALEIAVDWDCSQVSTPAFSGDGSLKWRWESTAPDFLVVKKTSSSSPSSNISDLKDERANIQFVISSPTCDPPTGLNVTNITASSADLIWTDSIATSYNWKLVLAGAGSGGMAVESGSTSMNMVSVTTLSAVTAYDLFVASDCGGTDTSDYAGPYTFTTLCAATPATAITAAITNVSCNGESDGAVDVTVIAGVPGYDFNWSNADTTEDISGLAAGTYTVTITDGDGCPYLDTVVVTEPDLLVASGTAIADTANAGLGAVSVSVMGGTPPYTYSWDGSAGSADSTGLTTGTYTVAVSDSNGCVDTVSVFVDDLVSIDGLDILEVFSLVPNPSSGRVNILLTLKQQSARIKLSLYSVNGQLIWEEGHRNTREINQNLDLSTQPNGLYFMRLQLDNQTISKKLILQR